MTTYTIEKKMSGTGTIYDIASDQVDREIVFAAGCKYAVVLASYYSGKGYTTHKTADAAIKQSRKLDRENYAHAIIDANGSMYEAACTGYGWELAKLPWTQTEDQEIKG
jgi:hypothetical protein